MSATTPTMLVNDPSDIIFIVGRRRRGYRCDCFAFKTPTEEANIATLAFVISSVTESTLSNLNPELMYLSVHTLFIKNKWA